MATRHHTRSTPHLAPITLGWLVLTLLALTVLACCAYPATLTRIGTAVSHGIALLTSTLQHGVIM